MRGRNFVPFVSQFFQTLAAIPRYYAQQSTTDGANAHRYDRCVTFVASSFRHHRRWFALLTLSFLRDEWGHSDRLIGARCQISVLI